ncbi:MAG: hypothetical protein KC475_02650 [Cyanobacteria bacterium HKST-UBA03]|nr:hypothetical protein [Cyanobacteria bacterium HKST-UBA03]
MALVLGVFLGLCCLLLLSQVCFAYDEQSAGEYGGGGHIAWPKVPEKPFFPPRKPAPYLTPEQTDDQYDIDQYRSNGYEPQTDTYAYEMPRGSMLSVILLDNLTTESALEGQPVLASVAQDMYVGQSLVLSRQDRVMGQVVRVDKPIEGRNAILEIHFYQLQLANGPVLPIDAVVDTGQSYPYWGGQLTKGTELKVVPYHIYQIGSYGRAMYRGPREKGIHIKIPPGERLVLTMQQPVKLYGF